MIPISKLNKLIAPTLIMLVFIFILPFASYAEKWRGPAHLGISTVGTFALAEIPTLFTDDYKVYNLYLFSGTLMLAAGFGKEALDEIVPGKKFTWEDIGLDLIGITLGITSHYLLMERRKRKIKPTLSLSHKNVEFKTTINF